MFYESQLHEQSCFVTLTYSNEFLPECGTLKPSDFTLWLKRIRKAVEPRRLRYFGVGEYGDNSERPHYHAILFGLSPLEAELVERTWGRGHVRVDEFNEVTAQYVAGYVVKKLTRPDDPRLNGRHPEFSRMSLRPGIGHGAMGILANSLLNDTGVDDYLRRGGVPTHLQIGRKSVPIGRYLRKALTDIMQQSGVLGHSQHVLDWLNYAQGMEASAEVQALQIRQGGDPKNSFVTNRTSVLKSWEGKLRNIEAREKINKARQRKPL